MKKYLLCVLIFISVKAQCQISLDTAINNSIGLGYGYKLVKISSSETKWFFCDTSNNSFDLLNLDFTPFILNIAVPEPFDFSNSFMQVLYVTRSLFDCDTSNIEYAYYSAFNNGKPFRIMRTDGRLLFQLDSANGPYNYGNLLGGSDVIRPIVNTDSGAKLFLQKYPLLTPIHVYSLCGSLPSDVFDFSELNMWYVTIYPNPSSKSLTLKINLPSNIEEYQFIIVDTKTTEIIRRNFNSADINLTISVDNLNSGEYFYFLYSKSGSLQSGRFIIAK